MTEEIGQHHREGRKRRSELLIEDVRWEWSKEATFHDMGKKKKDAW